MNKLSRFSVLVTVIAFLVVLPANPAVGQALTSIHPGVPLSPADVCPVVNNTPTFTFAYGDVTINSEPAPIGTVIEARSPRGDIVGCSVVSTTGKYGSMAVYGEDTTVTPAVPGMRSGETVRFFVSSNQMTTSTTLSWSDDKDLHSVNLSITSANIVTAAFTASNTSGPAPLLVSFTNQSIGNITDYLWSFGDGQTASTPNTTHSYTNPGTYTVTLTVSGPGASDSETKSAFVRVYTQVNAQFTADKQTGTYPLTVQFTNQTTGDWSGLQWNFGDGITSTQTNPSHNYANPGTYTVSLYASGLGGNDTETKTSFITVLQDAAVPDFSASVVSGIAPLQISFTNLSTGQYGSCEWDFGDGSTFSHDTNPVHTYAQKGIYSVRLTVTGPGGSPSKSKTNYITVYQPVTAQFSANKIKGTSPLQVEFTNSSTGDWQTVTWDFGDGSPADHSTNPVHAYETPGTYTVKLTVSGTGGTDQEEKIAYITVTDEQSVFLPMLISGN